MAIVTFHVILNHRYRPVAKHWEAHTRTAKLRGGVGIRFSIVRNHLGHANHTSNEGVVDVPHRSFSPGDVFVKLFAEVNWGVIGGFRRPPYAYTYRRPKTVQGKTYRYCTRLARPGRAYQSVRISLQLSPECWWIIFQHSFELRRRTSGRVRGMLPTMTEKPRGSIPVASASSLSIVNGMPDMAITG